MAEQEEQSFLYRNVWMVHHGWRPAQGSTCHHAGWRQERASSIRRPIALAEWLLVSKAMEEISMATWEDC